MTSLALLGDYSYFGPTSADIPVGTDWLVVPVCGVVGGLMGGLFIRVTASFAAGFPGFFGEKITRRPIFFALFCGLAVPLCGLRGDDSVFDTGFQRARQVIHGDGEISYWFGPLKFVATLCSAISGIPGGVFSPSLSIGVGFAADISFAFPRVPLGAPALVGMVSYLTGVIQAPITFCIVVSELTNDHAKITPLLAATLIADAASKSLSRQGLYHRLAENFLKRSQIGVSS